MKKNQPIWRSMLNYDDFPPIRLFTRVLQNSPKAASIYVTIWHKSIKSEYLIRKKDIKKTLLISPTIFRQNLIDLTRLDLISYQEAGDFFTIKHLHGA